MGFNNRKRKLSKDEGGVSEVIGNILILMITVILFTSIIAFVNQMPLPEQQTKVTFVADLVFIDSGTKANLSLRHAGGAVLDAAKTMILINKDGEMQGYNLSAEPGYSITSKWSTGGVWKRQLTNTSYSSIITITVVDMSKKTAVWTSQVTGGIGDNPPAILQRWVDSDTLTPSPDPVRDGNDFVFYATISDLDGDLDASKIWIDAHELAGSSSHWAWQERAGDVFSWRFDYINSTGIKAYKLDGGKILIHAEDKAGHKSESTFIMVVTKLPYDETINNYNWDTGGDDIGLDPRLPFKATALGAAYGTFEENHTRPGFVNMDIAKSEFKKDERVFIRVAHRYMTNALSLNGLQVLNSLTNRYYAPNYTGLSTAQAPFYIVGTAGATSYECQFNTSNLPPGTYVLNISMSSSPAGGNSVSFHAEPAITLRQTNSTISFLPMMKLYRTASCTDPWGTQAKPFNVSEGTYTIYVALLVMNTQLSPNPTAEEVRISDMAGGSEVYGKPGSGPMIPYSITRHNDTWYTWCIDLRYNNGNQWLTGSNSYALRLTQFADANEGLYSLTVQVFIKATSGKCDFFLGEDGITVGHANFDTKGYLTYIENNNFFTTQQLYTYTNTPSDRSTYTTTAVAFGDMTGDGARDILMGQDGSYMLLYYKNSMNSLGGFQSPSEIERPAADKTTVIRWIATGDINGDGATDFVYASASNKVVVYNNTYGIKAWIYHDYGATVVKKILLRDMTGDGKAELLTLAGGKVYVQDLSRWSPTNTYPIVAQIPDPDTVLSGITDFDVADMNADGMLDILTVGTGGDASLNGVWVNNYTMNPTPLVKHPNALWTVAGSTIGDLSMMNSPDGNAFQVQENLTAGSPPTGRVDVVVQFPMLDSSDKSQLLSIVAKINPPPGGVTEEVFYAWYSVDSDRLTANFIPMFAIANTDNFVNYTFRLPSMASGKQIFIKFTDSSTDPSGGSVPDCLAIDSVTVLANTYGRYYSVNPVSYRYQAVSNAPIVYTCVRAGNITGHNGHLDVVVARNGYWAAYDGKVQIPGFGETNNPNFYVQSTNALMANTAPTLFEVSDINGDGLSDILTCHKTLVQNTISEVGYYMNLYPDKIFYVVAELGRASGSGSITIANAINLIGA